MVLEINRLNSRLNPVISQWEGDDKLTLKDEVKLEEVEDVREIFSRLCEELQKPIGLGEAFGNTLSMLWVPEANKKWIRQYKRQLKSYGVTIVDFQAKV